MVPTASVRLGVSSRQTCVLWYAVLVLGFAIAYPARPSDEAAQSTYEGKEKLLFRRIRDTSNATVSKSPGGIVEFFQDNNNKAMYLVLPLIVLVYGGCSAIYCIAKCRRYIRKRNRQKKHKHTELKPESQEENINRGNPDGNERESVASERNYPINEIEKSSGYRSGSQLSDHSVPGQIADHDDKAPLVSGTARKHTPAPSVQSDRISAMDTAPQRQSRNARTPGSIEMEDMRGRNSNADSVASRAALFTVSNTTRNQTPSSYPSNRDLNTPSTSRQDVVWPPLGPPPKYSQQDPKAGFKAMFENNYNDPYSMMAMEMKARGQPDQAPWHNQIKYDEFGRPKATKKQRLIFVA